MISYDFFASLRRLTGDMVSSGLALCLDENWQIGGIFSVPCLEWFEHLKAVRAWRDLNLNLVTVLWWCLIGVLSRVVSAGWQSFPSRFLELEILPILILEGVSQGVEVQGAGKRHGDDQIRRRDEGMCGGVGIIAASEVTVVG